MVARCSSWDGYSEVRVGYAVRSSVSSVVGQCRIATGNGRDNASLNVPSSALQQISAWSSAGCPSRGTRTRFGSWSSSRETGDEWRVSSARVSQLSAPRRACGGRGGGRRGGGGVAYGGSDLSDRRRWAAAVNVSCAASSSSWDSRASGHDHPGGRVTGGRGADAVDDRPGLGLVAALPQVRRLEGADQVGMLQGRRGRQQAVVERGGSGRSPASSRWAAACTSRCSASSG